MSCNWIPSERVLSIQSHVVFGYVGGKAAVFPLQCLGYDVDVVNTVNFSNHSGYQQSGGSLGGSRTTVQELTDIFTAMELNELLKPTRVLTGYIPSGDVLRVVRNRIVQLKQTKPAIIYLLDPVIGDSGKVYVSPDVVPVYREMLTLATIITPNWFEVELLTEIKLEDMASLHRSLEILHNQYNIPHVVISSIPLEAWLLSSLPASAQPASGTHHLLCITSSRPTPDLPSNSTSIIHVQCVPLIPGYFSGVGDLFSALVLAHFHPQEKPVDDATTPLSEAVSKALTKTHAILQITHELSLTLPEEERQPTDDELDEKEPLRRIRRTRGRELALIRGQDIIRGNGIRHFRSMAAWDEFWNIVA